MKTRHFEQVQKRERIRSLKLSATLKDILTIVAPKLRERGFKGSGQNYRLIGDKAVCVINFQKSSGGERFYVNVGVQPLFVPTEAEIDPDAEKIKEPECIFRTRLDPPAPELSGWPYSLEHTDLLATRLCTLISTCVEPVMTIPGPLTDVSPADFDGQSLNPLLGVRHSRNFLHFARISLSLGNDEKAAEFAEAAMTMCPEHATILRRQLKELLDVITSSS